MTIVLCCTKAESEDKQHPQPLSAKLVTQSWMMLDSDFDLSESNIIRSMIKVFSKVLLYGTCEAEAVIDRRSNLPDMAVRTAPRAAGSSTDSAVDASTRRAAAATPCRVTQALPWELLTKIATASIARASGAVCKILASFQGYVTCSMSTGSYSRQAMQP